jgi:hypothetical protein
MPYSIGETVEPFSLRRAGGGSVTLDPAASEATIVAWTCNHCPYALAWHDRLQAVARDYAGKVTMLQINANDSDKYPADSFEAMEARVAAGEFASDYLRDDDQALSKSWGAKVTPDIFVLDRQGRIVYRGAPDGNYDEPSANAAWLRAALDDVLNGKPVSQSETKPYGCAVKWTVNDQPNPYE